jgi:hypothetical protein
MLRPLSGYYEDEGTVFLEKFVLSQAWNLTSMKVSNVYIYITLFVALLVLFICCTVSVFIWCTVSVVYLLHC